MSGPSYNAPAQPTYGEGMADAMKAQMEQLLGQGDFADIYADAGFAGGNLGDIIREVEAPIRQQTAQTDTDVLRQTLLGNQREIQVEQDPDTGKFGIAGAEVQREIIEGTANYRLEENFTERIDGRGVAHYRIIDNDTDEVIQSSFIRDVSTTDPAGAREELLRNGSFTQYFDDVQLERIRNPSTDLSSIEFEGKKSQPQTAGGGRYQMVQISEGSKPVPSTRGVLGSGKNGVKPTFAIIDTETGGITKKIGGQIYNNVDSGGMEYLAGKNGAGDKVPVLDENMKRIAVPSLEEIIQEQGQSTDIENTTLGEAVGIERPRIN